MKGCVIDTNEPGQWEQLSSVGEDRVRNDAFLGSLLPLAIADNAQSRWTYHPGTLHSDAVGCWDPFPRKVFHHQLNGLRGSIIQWLIAGIDIGPEIDGPDIALVVW